MAESRLGKFDAVIFDFDGTVIDTETPVYESWRQLFIAHEVEPISLDDWSDNIGLSERVHDPAQILEARVGRPLDRNVVETERQRLRNEMVQDLQIRAGVMDWFDAVRGIGLALGIGSSSPSSWVELHLKHRNLRDRFGVVSCAGDGVPGKPAPDVYLHAATTLQVDPGRCLVIEDSAHGVTAAVEAGMTCIAVPGPMTVTMNFDHAHYSGPSLAEFDPGEFLT